MLSWRWMTATPLYSCVGLGWFMQRSDPIAHRGWVASDILHQGASSGMASQGCCRKPAVKAGGASGALHSWRVVAGYMRWICPRCKPRCI